MFTKRHDFCIKSDKVLVFTRLLGEYGLKFKIGKSLRTDLNTDEQQSMADRLR